MKKVLLLCSAGMSTSLLVEKIKKAAKAKDIVLQIDAKPQIEATQVLDEYNVILLGPQVRFIARQVKDAVAGRRIGVGIIETITYGRMDGEKVLEQILSLMEE